MIHGLTLEAPRYPRLGKLRKGGEKIVKTRADGSEYETVGRDLGEKLRFSSDDPATEAGWFETFGSLQVQELTVLLPYPTVDECWQAWREDYGASALKVRCDGRQHVLWLDDKTGDYNDTPKPCPGETCQAKEVGRLDLMVIGFPRLGTVTLETHSLNDIANLDACLRLLALKSGDLTKVPLRLCRVQRNISRPKLGAGGKRTGERVRSPEWLLHIEPSPAWVQQQLDAQRLEVERLITGTATMALPDAAHTGAIDGEFRQATVEEVEAHFTERIAACRQSGEVEGLLAEIAGLENEFHRQAATRKAYARLVELAKGRIPDASENLLRQIRAKLDAMPADTEGLNAARDLVLVREQELAGVPA